MQLKKLFKVLSVVLISFLLFTGCTAQTQAVRPTPPGMINAALGPISPEDLGMTYVHEHFVFSYVGWYADESMAPYDITFKAAVKANVESIKKAQKHGIKTIIDATMNDTARDPELYKALTKKTGLNIICSTGLYYEGGGAPAYWKLRRYGTDVSGMISGLFIREITEGIGKSGVKAGVIKVGSSPQMTDYEKAVHKAAAIAQKATGVPIITHTQGPTGGIEQAEFLLKEGADPKKVMIGHVSNSKDTQYHKAILDKGVYIAFDRISLDRITPFNDIVNCVVELCKLGYSNRIMLSHDTVTFWPGRETPMPPATVEEYKNRHLGHIFEFFIPAIKARGVTDVQINNMLVQNPKNLFLGR